mgnify:FL=1
MSESAKSAMRDEIPPTPGPSRPAPAPPAGTGRGGRRPVPAGGHRPGILLDLVRAPDSPARHRAALAVIWAAAGAVLLAAGRNGWAGILFFVIYPLLWAVHRTRRSGVAATVAFSIGIGAATLVRSGSDAVAAGANGGLSCLFSLFIGLWFWRVYDISTALAAALDNERIAREALAAAQAELAAAERAAGRDAEHRRWAREVHDTLAQGFISVITLTQAARAELTRDRADEAASRLDQMEALARDNLAEARALVAGEGPSALRSGDLVQALNRLVDARRDPGLDIDLDARPPRDLARAVEVVVVRTVQEALSNIARHSRAARAQVVVAVERLGADRELAITVTDDGAGTGGAPEGTGLTGMRSRVESLGGTLTVDPARAPDADGRTGTVVEARIPL